MKSRVFTGIAASLLAAGTADCHEPSARQEPAAATEASLSVSDARLILPAVQGNPGAAYFTLVNRTKAPRDLIGVAVSGATGAMLHQSSQANGMASMAGVPHVDLPAGESKVFKPGGLHVMVMGVPEAVKPGDTVSVTLAFARGEPLSFPAIVKAAGDER